MPDNPSANDPLAGELAWAAYGALVTGGFVAAAIFGFGGRPLTMAVGAGAAALATASARVVTLPGVVALLVVVPATAAASVGGGRGRELVAALAVLVIAAWRTSHLGVAVSAGVGTAALASGIAVGRFSGDAGRFGLDAGDSALAAGALAAAALALVCAAAASDRPTPFVVLLVPGALAAFAAAAGPVAPHVTVAVAGVAAVVAIAVNRPAASLLGLAIASAAAVDEPAVTGLLAGAAVILAAFPGRSGVTMLAAIPGFAGLAAAVAADPTPRAAGAGGFAALCVTAAVLRFDTDQWLPSRPDPALWPVTVLAGWLAVAPQTWGWVGRMPESVAVSGRGLAGAVGIVAVAMTATAAAGKHTTDRK